MLSSHRFLPLSKVEVGMVLSDEVLDAQGHVLLPAGTVITANLLARLPAHGIDALPIAVAADTASAAVDRETVLRRTAHIFRRIDPHDPAHAPSRTLRRVVEAFRLGEVR